MPKYVAVITYHSATGGTDVIAREDLEAESAREAVRSLHPDYAFNLDMIGRQLWHTWRKEGQYILYLIGV